MIDDDDAAAAGGGGNGDWTPVSTPWGLLQEHVRATLIAGDYFGGANPPLFDFRGVFPKLFETDISWGRTGQHAHETVCFLRIGEWIFFYSADP